jgi:myo-inositol-1(or 4)-monophosphatase
VGFLQRKELRELTAFAHELCDLSDKATLPRFRKSIAVANKDGVGGFDPVTAGDKAAEKAIRKAIRRRYPNHGIVGEEFADQDAGARMRWVVDPIDGTRAFIMGAPMWGTILGLTMDGVPILGAMSQPFTAERFWSEDGKARWRQGGGKPKTLETRACASLDQAVLTSTHPDLFAAGEEMQRFQALKSRVRMTRFGGDCYGYCLLAAGFVDLVVEAGLKPYDIMGLIPIIEAAGGIVTTWDGGPPTAGGRILAAGDRKLHAKAMAVLAGK